MIALNVTNVITIGIISLIVIAGTKFAMSKIGMGTSWL